MRRRGAWVAAAVLATGLAALGVVGAVVGLDGHAGPGVGGADASAATIGPQRSFQPDGGQFLASCPYSHSATDDPIVHRGMPGMSHLHEFFGATTTDAASTYASLVASTSTCSDDGDHSGYWAPALYADGVRVEPRRIDAYYRVAPGVAPADVEPFPDGLQALAGDQHARSAQPLPVVAWSCGLSPSLSSEPPTTCTADRPVQLRLTFPSCWDGRHVATADHTSHLSYPGASGCPSSHPVPVPQLTMVVHYPLYGDFGRAMLASGDVHTAHGDFFDGWTARRIHDQVVGCLNRSVTCGIAGGTFHTGQGAGDDDTYNLPGEGATPAGSAGSAPG